MVDKALATWQQRTAELARQHAGSKLARDIDGAKAKLANLTGMRSSMDSLAAKPQEVFDYYGAVTSLLASAIDEIGEVTEEAGIARQAIALGAHVRRKEWAAQERSTGGRSRTRKPRISRETRRRRRATMWTARSKGP